MSVATALSLSSLRLLPASPTASSCVAIVAGELPADRLALLPPTVIIDAEFDDLRASGEQFAGPLREAGVPVVEHVQAGTVHGYLNRPEESDPPVTTPVRHRPLRGRAARDLQRTGGLSKARGGE